MHLLFALVRVLLTLHFLQTARIPHLPHFTHSDRSPQQLFDAPIGDLLLLLLHGSGLLHLPEELLRLLLVMVLLRQHDHP